MACAHRCSRPRVKNSFGGYAIGRFHLRALVSPPSLREIGGFLASVTSQNANSRRKADAGENTLLDCRAPIAIARAACHNVGVVG